MKFWSSGAIFEDPSLLLGPSDRAVEHGIGLFETLRTWAGRPILLDRHLDRLRKSAQALRLAIDPGTLPDAEAVRMLLRESDASADSVVRITLTGGSDRDTPGRIWMRTRPLPAPIRDSGGRIVLGGFGLDWYDPLVRHKTLNYWSRSLIADRALALGADDAILGTPDGRVWESTRANLFLVVDGELITPGLEGPILPGIMRALVIELAGAVGLAVHEDDVDSGDVDWADEVFLTNSVRGIVPVGCTPGSRLSSPGIETRRLQDALSAWIRDRKETIS